MLLIYIEGFLKLWDVLDVVNDKEYLLNRIRDVNVVCIKLSYLYFVVEIEKMKNLFEFMGNKEVF